MIALHNQTNYQCEHCNKIFRTKRGIDHTFRHCKKNDNSLVNNKDQLKHLLGQDLFPEVKPDEPNSTAR